VAAIRAIEKKNFVILMLFIWLNYVFVNLLMCCVVCDSGVSDWLSADAAGRSSRLVRELLLLPRYE
jgi:hypothetical protein